MVKTAPSTTRRSKNAENEGRGMNARGFKSSGRALSPVPCLSNRTNRIDDRGRKSSYPKKGSKPSIATPKMIAASTTPTKPNMAGGRPTTKKSKTSSSSKKPVTTSSPSSELMIEKFRVIQEALVKEGVRKSEQLARTRQEELFPDMPFSYPTLPLHLQRKRTKLFLQQSLLRSRLKDLKNSFWINPTLFAPAPRPPVDTEQNPTVAHDDLRLRSKGDKSVYDTGRSYEEMERCGFPAHTLRKKCRALLKQTKLPPMQDHKTLDFVRSPSMFPPPLLTIDEGFGTDSILTNSNSVLVAS